MDTTRFFSRKSNWVIVAALLLLAGAFGACSTVREHVRTYKHLKAYAKETGEERDLSPQRTSDNGLYRATIKPQTGAVPLNQLHTWTLHVETPDSAAVNVATIAVDGGMPEHGHGLPTRPRVTQVLGGGDYLVEGMKFQMPGWWVVEFAISTSDGTDTVTFNLML